MAFLYSLEKVGVAGGLAWGKIEVCALHCT